MRSNPTNLGEFLSGADLAALREAFDTPAQAATSWREQAPEAIPWIGGTVLPPPDDRWANALYNLEHLKNNPPLLQGNDPSQSTTRLPDGKEKGALKFTFGSEVGETLNNTIEIGEGHADAVTATQMLMPPYKSKDLRWLGEFISKAARIWQLRTGRYTEDDERYDGYNYEQLYSTVVKDGQRTLNLSSTEHAEAVKHWFYVNYGIEYNLIAPDDVHRTGFDHREYADNQIRLRDLWTIVLGVLELKLGYRSEFGKGWLGGERAALRQIVNNHYACVITELRDPTLIQLLAPTADTQITSWGAMRTGG